MSETGSEGKPAAKAGKASNPQARRNKRVALICVGAFAGMVGAAYASVPLYKLFCQVTGFDGTVRVQVSVPEVEAALVRADLWEAVCTRVSGDVVAARNRVA